MRNEEIQQKKEELFERIKKSKQELALLRATCKHEKTSVYDYEWRVGSIVQKNLCDYCGEVVRL